MMIYVKNEKGRRFAIPAPIWLMKAGLSFGGVGMRIAEKHMTEDQKQYLQDIDFRELRKGFDVLKSYKGLTMIDIRAKDGTELKIIV